jgi:hypothetical protein
MKNSEDYRTLWVARVGEAEGPLLAVETMAYQSSVRRAFVSVSVVVLACFLVVIAGAATSINIIMFGILVALCLFFTLALSARKRRVIKHLQALYGNRGGVITTIPPIREKKYEAWCETLQITPYFTATSKVGSQ